MTKCRKKAPAVLAAAAHAAAELPHQWIATAFDKPRFSRLAAQRKCDAPRRAVRPRLWQLDAMLHCSIIGTCLSVQELRRLARRARVEDVDGFSDYNLHSSAVHRAVEKSPFTEAIQKELDRKYRAEINRLAACRDPDDLLRYWQAQLAAGDVAGAFWTLVTHADVTPALAETVGRDVHMLSHQVGAGQRANLRRLKELEEENARLRDALDKQRIAHAQRTDEAREALARAQAETRHARMRTRRLNDAAAVDTSARRLAALEDQLAQLRGHAVELERRLAEAQDGKQKLAADLRTARDTAASAELCLRALSENVEEAAGMPDLAGRDLLCVGGRTNLQEHYRSLTERCNARFSYHDGGFEDGALRLHGLLARADAVICPADCVSHPIYNEVKRMCKRTGKPCVLLSNSGLGSFTRGLCALAPGKDVAMTEAKIISL